MLIVYRTLPQNKIKPCKSHSFIINWSAGCSVPGGYFTSKTPDNSVFFPNCFGGRELFFTAPLDFPLLCPQDMGLICHICRTALIKLSLEQKVICFCGFFFSFTFWLSRMACRILASQHGTRAQAHAPCSGSMKSQPLNRQRGPRN